MIADSDTGTSSATPFDPAAWLNTLVGIGGGYALASGRKLWLVVQECSTGDLTPLMAQIVAQPERQEAIKAAIERKQLGYVG
ncbi:hypothetical protein KZ813_17800 [Sphingomonas sp. RHCKR7]|uniref:hypothetical protein n=1 Tax=Sphingomonas folli TaxID=2862497 RepID=UPI001CA56886|nr:hypothetical protein [Sphingomonas folli]MBW6528700.1 hypothetical protein [Sphingomonas folli]